MRVSNLFGGTLSEPPSDVELESHGLLVRAGYVRQLAAGIFSYLPLAWRSLRKVEQILREEMDAIGGQEMNMPVVHPAEIWKRTGRWQAIDESMVRFQDRRQRDMVLAMTHEEVVADLTRTEITSYRQLPMMVYHIQTKFRDEPRARGGLIRVREFVMKDSYTLDRDVEGLQKQYADHYRAYLRIGARVGLDLVAVGSDVGIMGGAVAHEFMYLSPAGEDTLVLCDGCHRAANREVARFARPAPPADDEQPLEKVATPGATTVAEVAEVMGVPLSGVGKAVFLMADFPPDENGVHPPDRLVVIVVRGDMEVNVTQIRNHLAARDLRPAHDEEIEEAGAVAGYGSPIGLDAGSCVVLVDEIVAEAPRLVMGANEAGFHVRNARFGRDFHSEHVGPFAAAFEGAPCAACGEPLRLARGIEVGNIFQLGTKYSAALEALYTDEKGQTHPVVMGSYGIGVGRTLACVAEEHRDDAGLALPISVAPFEVSLLAIGKGEEIRQEAERLYQELCAAGVEVLFDDRDVSPGVKFVESDLRGMPLRVVLSGRSLKAGGAELKRRTAPEGTVVPRAEVVAAVRREIEELHGELRRVADAVGPWDGSH